MTVLRLVFVCVLEAIGKREEGANKRRYVELNTILLSCVLMKLGHNSSIVRGRVQHLFRVETSTVGGRVITRLYCQII